MKCCFCSFASASQERLLRHHRLRHGRGAYWPCVYSDCVCTFKTPGALKSHLTRSHCRTAKIQDKFTFFCDLCEFWEICTQQSFFTHLGRHFKKHETVCCPFLRCSFKTNNLKTFSSHYLGFEFAVLIITMKSHYQLVVFVLHFFHSDMSRVHSCDHHGPDGNI